MKSLARGGRRGIVKIQSVNPRSIGQLDDPAEDSVGLSLTYRYFYHEQNIAKRGFFRDAPLLSALVFKHFFVGETKFEKKVGDEQTIWMILRGLRKKKKKKRRNQGDIVRVEKNWSVGKQGGSKSSCDTITCCGCVCACSMQKQV